MGFQTEIKSTQALGVAGQIAKGFHSFCNTQSGLAITDIEVGSFVFRDKINGKAGEISQANGQVLTANTTSILGVAVKNEFINAASGTSSYLKGQNVTYLNEGSIYILNTSGAKAEQGMLASFKADGSLVFAYTIAQDNIFTGFKVEKGGENNELLVITTAGVK